MENVSLNFIAELPRVGEFDHILVVIDRFSKYATFVPMSKYCSTEETAKAFFKNIMKYWGISKSIVSDRDARFIGLFLLELFKLLGTNLDMSISFYPQIDGQME